MNIDDLLKYADERGIQIPSDILLDLSDKKARAILDALKVDVEIPIFSMKRPGLVPRPQREGLILTSDKGWQKPQDATFIQNIGGLSTNRHSNLKGLDYASAGHTDFAGTKVENTFTQSNLFGDKVKFTQTDGNEYIDSLNDGYMDYRATTAHRFGDGSNQVVISGAGEITLEGTATVWNDANVGSLVLVTGGTLPGVVELLESDGGASGIYTRGFAVGEQGSGTIEIPHDYKEGSNITFHVHWVGQDAPTGTDNVRWQLTYSVTRGGVVTPAATTVVAANDTAFDTQYMWMRTDVATITGTNFKIGDQFNFTLTRIAASGDAYAGEAIVATLGLHYECDTMGSKTITDK